jgi:hypothetical protein
MTEQKSLNACYFQNCFFWQNFIMTLSSCFDDIFLYFVVFFFFVEDFLVKLTSLIVQLVCTLIDRKLLVINMGRQTTFTVPSQ